MKLFKLKFLVVGLTAVFILISPLVLAKEKKHNIKEMIKAAGENVEKADEELNEKEVEKRNREREVEIREHFEKGNALYKEGKLKEAKEEWQKVLAISKDPQMKDYIRGSEKRAKAEEIARKKEEREKQKRVEAEKREKERQEKEKKRQAEKEEKQKKGLEAKKKRQEEIALKGQKRLEAEKIKKQSLVRKEQKELEAEKKRTEREKLRTERKRQREQKNQQEEQKRIEREKQRKSEAKKKKKERLKRKKEKELKRQERRKVSPTQAGFGASKEQRVRVKERFKGVPGTNLKLEELTYKTEKECLDVLEKKPGNKEAFDNLVKLYRLQNRYIGRGKGFHNKGDYQAAIEEFKKALAIEPGNKKVIRWMKKAKDAQN